MSFLTYNQKSKAQNEKWTLSSVPEDRFLDFN